MSMLRRAIGSLEDSIERLGQSARWAVWPVLYAMSVATSLWLWRHSARAKLYVGNRIAFTERSEIGIWVAVALGALLSVYALAVGVDRFALATGVARPS